LVGLLLNKKVVLCLRINLNNKYLLHRSKGAWGSLFISTTQKTPKPVTAPNVKRSVDRHKKCPSLWVHCSWGCFIICKIMVPFHDLWIDGGETEKRPPWPQFNLGSSLTPP
jgi:hypothetical protein